MKEKCECGGQIKYVYDKSIFRYLDLEMHYIGSCIKCRKENKVIKTTAPDRDLEEENRKEFERKRQRDLEAIRRMSKGYE